jgi:hypothetical protein
MYPNQPESLPSLRYNGIGHPVLSFTVRKQKGVAADNRDVRARQFELKNDGIRLSTMHMHAQVVGEPHLLRKLRAMRQPHASTLFHLLHRQLLQALVVATCASKNARHCFLFFDLLGPWERFV